MLKLTNSSHSSNSHCTWLTCSCNVGLNKKTPKKHIKTQSQNNEKIINILSTFYVLPWSSTVLIENHFTVFVKQWLIFWFTDKLYLRTENNTNSNRYLKKTSTDEVNKNTKEQKQQGYIQTQLSLWQKTSAAYHLKQGNMSSFSMSVFLKQLKNSNTAKQSFIMPYKVCFKGNERETKKEVWSCEAFTFSNLDRARE